MREENDTLPILCQHYTKPYQKPFDMEPPSKTEIKENRLYQCKSCKKWYSLIGKGRKV